MVVEDTENLRVALKREINVPTLMMCFTLG